MKIPNELKIMWDAFLIREFGDIFDAVDVFIIDKEICLTFNAHDGSWRIYKRDGLSVTFIELESDEANEITRLHFSE